MLFLKNGNNNTKTLAYTSLFREILEYVPSCSETYWKNKTKWLNLNIRRMI
jgi:hypothetical protein